MYIFYINIIIYNFDVFYVFRTQWFVFRKTVLYRVRVWHHVLRFMLNSEEIILSQEMYTAIPNL